MIILITGASHVGKTQLAQKLLEKYKYPYLSADHLKMGLIRSGNTKLTPLSNDEKLAEYLWPIIREIIRTAIENKQNLIVEGCYIPLDAMNDFDEEYAENIRFYCLVMTEKYIINHFDDIKKYANVIESRIADDDFGISKALEENSAIMLLAEKNNINCIIIDEEYNPGIDL